MVKKPSGRPKYWTKENLAELKELWTRNTPMATLQHRFAEDDVKSGTSKPKTPFAIQAQIIRLIINDLKNVHDESAKEKLLTIYRIPAYVRQNLDFYTDGHWEKDPLEQPNPGKTKPPEHELLGEIDEFAEPQTPIKKEVREEEPVVAPPPRKEAAKPEAIVSFVPLPDAVNEVPVIQKSMSVIDREAVKLLVEIRDQIKITNELLKALIEEKASHSKRT